MKKENIGMCGLDCSRCPAFIATSNNDDDLRKKTAKEWTERHNSNPILNPEDINCKGCLSDGLLSSHCSECKVRKCGLEKGIKNCKDCKEYKCNELTELQSHLF